MRFSMPVRSLSSRVLKWPDAATVESAVRAWAEVRARGRNDVLRIGYFGSYARGNWGVGSDVDLLILIAASNLPFQVRATGWDATRLPVPADVLVYTIDEWNRLEGNSAFYDTVMREAIWLYPDEPRISVGQVSRRRAAEAGHWIVGWSIRNVGSDPLTIDAAWLPHGQFRGDRTELRSPPTLESGQATELELPVQWDEPVGSIVENAFLILTIRWHEEPWRILTRITVHVDDDGTPDARTQNMTVQQIGFSRPRPIE